MLETGEQLIAAKEGPGKLPHGEFEAMIEKDLPFGPSTAQRLMIIWRNPQLSNPAHAQLLPPYWFTLYELSKLKDEEFSVRLAAGEIRPDPSHSQIWLFRWHLHEDRVAFATPRSLYTVSFTPVRLDQETFLGVSQMRHPPSLARQRQRRSPRLRKRLSLRRRAARPRGGISARIILAKWPWPK